MWVLPTKRRIDNVRRFLRAAREMGSSTPGIILVNSDELRELNTEYEALKVFLLPGWEIVGVDADCYGKAIRCVWSEVKDRDWIGLVSDDHIPSSSGWDKSLIESLNGWNVVSSNDGWQAPNRIHGAIVWSGELARTVGWIFPERFRHLFHDDLWETVGRESGCWHVRMDVIVRHAHEALEGKIGPTMDRNSPLFRHDEARYQEWLRYEKDSVVAKIKALMDSKGVRQVRADFTGAKVLIATPSIDGRYEGAYMVGLFDTMRRLQENGVFSSWAEEKYTAEVDLARNKLVGAFLRTDFTHLLMIDADMGWDFNAIIRLFYPKRDFVAIAGPKKRYPISFAVNHTDDKGTPLALAHDNATATMRVSEIGMAFCLMSRSCIERMVRAYPELEYDGVTGQPEWALFNPLIANRRRYGEDFAFCFRWRQIRGEILMVPDVPLTHTGPHQFKGAFSDTFQKPKEEIPQMADAAD